MKRFSVKAIYVGLLRGSVFTRENERDLTQSYDKILYTNENLKK